MLSIIKLLRQIAEGSISALILVAIVAAAGVSDTINILLSEPSISSIAFLLIITVLLADLIAKLIGILGNTFPDLIPKVGDEDRKAASIISRLRPGTTLAILSGTHVARLVFFGIVFSLLGLSYANAPAAAQAELVGTYDGTAAIEIFIREGFAGSVGYFLFFLGPETLKPITDAIAPERVAAQAVDGEIFLAAIRLYGLAFALAVLRTIVMPIVLVRARLRARHLESSDFSAPRATSLR